MHAFARPLGAFGALVALPAFSLNVIAHGGTLPGPDDVDRLDGVFSLQLMVEVAFIVSGLALARPSPLGRWARWLLYIEAGMVTLAGVWSAMLAVDPALIEDESNPLVVVGDACWPLHQALMLFVGIAAARAALWPSPARYALFGPAVGLTGLLTAAAADLDVVAALSIGIGWAVVGGAVALTVRDGAASDPEATAGAGVPVRS